MKTLVVYFSKFGNTHKVADTIAKSISSNGGVRTIELTTLTKNDLKDLDLLVMGSPTHKMNLPEAVRPVFSQFPKRILSGTQVAAFDTSYKMSRWLNKFTAAKHLAKKLRKLGGKLIVPPETFHVIDREGPLYNGELERVRDWATFIHEKAINEATIGHDSAG
ncbi:MAG: flavodoxin family protein [Anaerolineales bacterium]|jgi:flavodoxin